MQMEELMIIEDAVKAARVRIRFAGTEDAETFHMAPSECIRFHSEWRSYLNGDGSKGGEYTCEDGDHTVLISLNFDQVAYTEPGKVY
jgi:hypothetical protein